MYYTASTCVLQVLFAKYGLVFPVNFPKDQESSPRSSRQTIHEAAPGMQKTVLDGRPAGFAGVTCLSSHTAEKAPAFRACQLPLSQAVNPALTRRYLSMVPELRSLLFKQATKPLHSFSNTVIESPPLCDAHILTQKRAKLHIEWKLPGKSQYNNSQNLQLPHQAPMPQHPSRRTAKDRRPPQGCPAHTPRLRSQPGAPRRTPGRHPRSSKA